MGPLPTQPLGGKVNEAKFEQKKTQNMRKKHQMTFQSKWLAEVCQFELQLDADSVSYCNIYPSFSKVGGNYPVDLKIIRSSGQ
jgi:hypothetical protein